MADQNADTATREDARVALSEALIELWTSRAPALDQYRWPMEQARWSELVFCLVRRVTAPTLDAVEARNLTGTLDALGLLSPAELAATLDAGRLPARDTPEIRLCLSVMERFGLSAETSEAAWITIAEAARGLQAHHGGFVQRYLRHYGEQVLADLGNQFRFSRLDGDDVAAVFTHWLQNALDLPLFQGGEAAEKMAHGFDLKITDLVEVADELGLNLAAVDDMLQAVDLDLIDEFSSMPDDIARVQREPRTGG